MSRLLVLTLIGLVAAQTAPLPQFDVASVKPNTLMEQPSNNWKVTPGRIDYHNSQLFQLIQRAYADFATRVEGGPDWIRTGRFDVVVQFPIDTPAPTLQLMLRQLLIDRFKLAAHVETREVPTYSLVLARADRQLGPKLQPPVPECAPTARSNPPPQCGRGGGRGFIDFGAYDMAMVARILSNAVGRRVVDNTGLTGNYKIELKFTPPAPLAPPSPNGTPNLPPVTPDDAPDVFVALREQLGLKLEDSKGPIQVIVVDRIEQPTPD